MTASSSDNNNNGDTEEEDCFIYNDDQLSPRAPENVVSARIAPGTVAIRVQAFCHRRSLTTVQNCAAETLEIIELDAFLGCSSFSNENFFREARRLTRIGRGGFSGCGFQNVDLSGATALRTIQNYAFAYCETLETVRLPSGLDSIRISAFFRCVRLRHILLADTVQELGRSCFAACTSLQKVHIPASVGFLGSLAFNECDALETITFESTRCLLTTPANNAPLPSCPKLHTICIQQRIPKVLWPHLLHTFLSNRGFLTRFGVDNEKQRQSIVLNFLRQVTTQYFETETPRQLRRPLRL